MAQSNGEKELYKKLKERFSYMDDEAIREMIEIASQDRKQHELNARNRLLDTLTEELENTPLAYAVDAGDYQNAWGTSAVTAVIEGERLKS